jgi:hypothetical protein
MCQGKSQANIWIQNMLHTARKILSLNFFPDYKCHTDIGLAIHTFIWYYKKVFFYENRT